MIKEKFTIGPSEDAKMIRETVFVNEQGFKEEFDEEDKRSISLVLYLDTKAIGTGRLVEIDPETYQLGRLAVLKEYRGQKVGTYLVKFLEVKARSVGGRKIILNAQLDKVPFYQKLGFTSEGEIFLEENYPHLRMEKTIVKIKKKYPRKTY